MTDTPGGGTSTPPLQRFYLTFGVKYRREHHPYWEGAHPDGWLLIEAADEDGARTLAHQYLGEFWSMLYPPGHFNEADNQRDYYPRGQIGRLSSTTEGIL